MPSSHAVFPDNPSIYILLKSRYSCRMPVPVRRRISCSVEATGASMAKCVESCSQLLSRVLARYPAWLIWGTLFFLCGWMLVGLSIIALGERILRTSQSLVMIVAGIGGAVVTLLPIALTRALRTARTMREQRRT